MKSGGGKTGGGGKKGGEGNEKEERIQGGLWKVRKGGWQEDRRKDEKEVKVRRKLEEERQAGGSN